MLSPAFSSKEQLDFQQVQSDELDCIRPIKKEAKFINMEKFDLAEELRNDMGSELAEWTHSMTQLPFFQIVSFTHKDSELKVLLQSMMLLDTKYNLYAYEDISIGEVRKYCRAIRNNYGENRRKVVQSIIEYLSKAFPQKEEYLNQFNIPIIFIMADMVVKHNLFPLEFGRVVARFYDYFPSEYEENTESDNIKREEIEGRLGELYQVMLDWFGFAVYPEKMRDDFTIECKDDETMVSESAEQSENK